MNKEIKIRLNKEGEWYYEGEEVINEKIKDLFNKSIKKKDDKYILEIEGEEYEIEFEDTVYFVKVVNFRRINHHISLVVTLNDKSKEEINPEDIFLKGNIFYCRVKEGKELARFTRSAHQTLFNLIGFDEDKQKYYLDYQGIKYYLPTIGKEIDIC